MCLVYERVSTRLVPQDFPSSMHVRLEEECKGVRNLISRSSYPQTRSCKTRPRSLWKALSWSTGKHHVMWMSEISLKKLSALPKTFSPSALADALISFFGDKMSNSRLRFSCVPLSSDCSSQDCITNLWFIYSQNLGWNSIICFLLWRAVPARCVSNLPS